MSKCLQFSDKDLNNILVLEINIINNNNKTNNQAFNILEYLASNSVAMLKTYEELILFDYF